MTQSKASEMWLELPWKKFQKETFRLQRRIFEASRREDWVTTFNLQKLLFSSYSARMIAIRQVIQLNSGKNTAGIDGKTSLTNLERFTLERKLYYEAKRWKHQGLRQVPIPKSDFYLQKSKSKGKSGRVRMLKIPTISDRAWQCLVKLALEPAHEAWFNKRSYGFRPGRCTHDVQRFLFANLNSRANGSSKRIIELDIEKCFDRISHQSILKKAIAPQRIKKRLEVCLKTGVDPEYPEQGTPQGGVISPLLANILLNGIEDIHTSVRYADDMVIILKPEDDEKDILNKISNFLSKNGMNVNNKKTKVSTTQLGFDFLGWNFRVTSENKFISTPSKDNHRNLKMKLNEIIKNSAYGVDKLVKHTSTIVRGWRNYHKHCDMSKHNLWHLNHKTWKRLIKQPSVNRKKADTLVRKAFPPTAWSVNRFVMVKGNKSPFDGDLIYWAKRNSKFYTGATSRVLKANKYLCHYCNHYFNTDEKIELHHIDGNHNNWKIRNLHVLHKSCHDIVHSSKH